MRFKQITIITLILLTSLRCTTPKESKIGIDSTIEKRVDELLSKMTLEEKIGQLNQVSAGDNLEQIIAGVKTGEVGSILNLVDPITVNKVQKAAMEESRLGIPLIIARDVIHGFKTMFPIPLGLASTFNPQLVEQGARIAAIEATAAGVRWTFSPMLDIARDARWGRIAEGSGEDPYLNTQMGVAMVKGYQGENFTDPSSMAACIKHFIGYGAAIGGRDYNTTSITEREMRNIYLPAFEACVQAGALTLMTSFNDNDGIPSTGNKFILKDILRDEWGFNGFVVTDWNSAGEMISHGFAHDGKEAAEIAINAGVDMDMMSFTFAQLGNSVKEGKVSEATINNAVRNILRVKFQLGLFENPYTDTTLINKVTYTAENLEAAKQTAIESTILLKNDGTLPIDASKIKTVLITGPMADAPFDQLGTWTFDGEESHTITPYKAIKESFGDRIKIIYEPGLTYSREVNAPGIAKAVSAARNADIILAFMGEEAILSGEAHCLTDLNLKGSQTELLSSLKRIGKPIVTTIMAGRPLTIGKEVEYSNSMLYSFHPGTMGGAALSDLIFGKAVPSGKSPVTFPVSIGQIPFYYNMNMTGRPYTGNEKTIDQISLKAGQTSLGNTSYWLDLGFAPLFPFGFGLSYSTFEYSNIKIDRDNYAKDDTIHISFNLKNNGKYDATEVVQVYTRDLVGSVTRPIKELKKFERIALKAGMEKEIKIELPIKELEFWNIDMKKVVESGEFYLWVSTDSNSGTPIKLKVN